MDIFISILFLFASLGVVNGLLVGLFLWLKKNKTASDFYLGGLLIALGIRIGKSVFLYFIDGPIDRLVLQIGLSACIFIGPFFFLYVHSLLKPVLKNEANLLLSVLFIAITVIGILYPYRQNPDIWNGYIVHGIYAIWSFCSILGIYFGVKQLKKKYQELSIKLLLRDQLFIILCAITFITFTYQLALYTNGFTYIWGAIGFTLFFYYMMANVLIKKGKTSSSKVSEPIENASFLLEKLDHLMEEEKLFLNPKLKLDDLAKASNLKRNLLSRLLNEEYKHGFSTYINEFRVSESMQLIQNRSELSLEGIGYEAGFNSKSSFFSAFKKIANCTPSQFKKQLNPIEIGPK